ncbi:MAG: PIN domain-containing protein [Actinomycetota bacterium]|nr:PIN domain-containing protein [Actinomycetota bacterium]
MPDVVVDASAMVDALAGTPVGPAVAARLRDHTLHAPAHFDAEVLSALGRLQRAGVLSARQVGLRVQRLEAAPVQRHLLAPLLKGAWRRRHNLRLVDALYAQLADDLGTALVTTDAGLSFASATGELVEPT